MNILHNTILIVASPAVWLTTALPAVGQGPLDTYAFKGTHNSYSQTATVDSQIQNYNVWCLELDICSPSSDSVVVTHWGCEDASGTLSSFLTPVVQATSWRHRLTFVWLDIKHDSLPWPCYSCDEWPNDDYQLVRDRLNAVLPANSVYTRSEFDNVDGGRWPSVATLLARGRHFVVVLDGGHWDTDKPLHPYFFVTAQSVAEASKHGAWWVAFINTKNASLPAGEAPIAGDRYMWRSYDLNDAQEFDDALSRQFNILSTDEYRRSWTFDNRTYPPAPIVVVVSSPHAAEYGTWRFPFTTVAAGAKRATPGSQLSIKAGVYIESLNVSKRLLLSAWGGPVVIGQ